MAINKTEFTKKTKLIIGVSLLAFIMIVAIGFLIIKSQNRKSDTPSQAKLSSSETKEKRTVKKEKEKRSEEKKADEETDHIKGVFKSSSMNADGIEFTIADVKRSGEEVTIIVRMHNSAKANKSVAIYDDYVRWPKSTLVEQNGTSHEVNKVMFTKEGKTLTSQAAGTQGLSISPGQTATVSLTYKNAGKGFRKFMLHPFVYTGRNWTEHNLLMKSDI
jgi:uncharacterized protein YxeA